MSEQGLSSPLIAKYQRVIEKNPKSRVFAPLAESYRQLGMIDNAIEVLKQGIRYNPDYALGYLGMASCYHDLKKYSLAYATLRPIVETNRDNLRLQRLFASICELNDHYEEALETYKYLLFVNPRDEMAIKKVAELEHKDNSSVLVETPVEVLETKVEEPRLFNTDSLTSGELEDVDNWTKIDFSTSKPEEEKVEEVIEEIAEEEVEEEIEETAVDEEEQLNGPSEVPVITHTLVDIYCNQGYFGKAKEVLLKILELNPSDEKTEQKLKEVEAKMGDSTENRGHARLTNILDEKLGKSEENRADQVREKFDQFMSGIKKRAAQSLE